MARRVNLPEYLRNTRELLRLDAAKFSLMIERQVQVRVLPSVAGPRAELEEPLWQLLLLCLDGHEADAPPLTQAAWEKALSAAQNGQAVGNGAAAPYPRAARAVLQTLTTLREVGVFPPPKLK